MTVFAVLTGSAAIVSYFIITDKKVEEEKKKTKNKNEGKEE
jgi:hypothetical protein